MPLHSSKLTMPRDCQPLHESYHKKHNLQIYIIYHRMHKLHKWNDYIYIYIYTLHKFKIDWLHEKTVPCVGAECCIITTLTTSDTDEYFTQLHE